MLSLIFLGALAFVIYFLFFGTTSKNEGFCASARKGVSSVFASRCSRTSLPGETGYRGVEELPDVGNFMITNHLNQHHVRVTVSEKVPGSAKICPTEGRNKTFPSGAATYYEEFELASKIEPGRSVALRREYVVRYLAPGNMLHFYVSDQSQDSNAARQNLLFAHYVIQDQTGLGGCDSALPKRIKSLHVGMITTRTIGDATYLRQAHSAGNAVGGASKVRIHNLSELRLCLNSGTSEETHIPAHGIEQYKGYLNQGVPLGTLFTDADAMYPTFQYLEPHSDLYYGVVSDIQQPLSGCFQHEYNDRCDYGQTLWPFQEGVM